MGTHSESSVDSDILTDWATVDRVLFFNTNEHMTNEESFEEVY